MSRSEKRKEEQKERQLVQVLSNINRKAEEHLVNRLVFYSLRQMIENQVLSSLPKLPNAPRYKKQSSKQLVNDLWATREVAFKTLTIGELVSPPNTLTIQAPKKRAWWQKLLKSKE